MLVGLLAAIVILLGYHAIQHYYETDTDDMATILEAVAQLQAAVDALPTRINQQTAALQAQVDALTQQAAALTAQVADVQPAADAVSAAAATLNAIAAPTA